VTTSFDDAWNIEQRDEVPLRRADRNFAELLQELRVVFTGVQILFGFLLALSFSQRFAELDGFQRTVFVVTLICAALTSMFLLAPVAAHRLLFQDGRKRELVTTTHRFALAGLLALAFTMAAGLLLVLDLTVPRWLAVTLAAALLVGTAVLWLAVPFRLHRAARLP
jgi:SNF family Na+-dependent transporter